jgi:argininosuccinate lyase
VPQRSAHEIVGKLVRKAMDRGVRLVDLTVEEFRSVDASLDDSLRGMLGVENAVARFVSYGSTAPSEVEKQIQVWQKRVKANGGAGNKKSEAKNK